MIRIEECSPQDFARLFNRVWPDQASDPTAIETEMRVFPKERHPRHWWAVGDGTPIGCLEVGYDQGSYHPRRLQISLGVIPSHRRQGLGALLYQTARAFLESKEAEVVQGWAQDTADAIRFASVRGFSERKRTFWSVLNVRALTQEGIEVLATQPPAELSVQSLEVCDTIDRRRSIHQFFETVRHDIPRTHPPTPLSLEEFCELVLDDPGLIRACSFFAFDGSEAVAMSTAYRSASSDVLEQGLTAVARSWRGRGLATAMKAKVINQAINAGYTEVRTDNDSKNAPILAINRRLGFVNLPATLLMEKP